MSRAKKIAKELIEEFTLYLGTDNSGEEVYVEDLEARKCAQICAKRLAQYAPHLTIKSHPDGEKCYAETSEFWLLVKGETENITE